MCMYVCMCTDGWIDGWMDVSVCRYICMEDGCMDV